MVGMPTNLDLKGSRTAAEQQRLFSKGTAEVPLAELLPSPENGRKRLRKVKELADSFDDDGVVQALTVVTAATYISHYPQHREYVASSGKPYVVLHGHRRLAAAEVRGLEKVPVLLRKTVKENGSLRLAAIKENEQRENLDPIEQGTDYQNALAELQISQRELARRLGLSQGPISQKIKLLKLIEPLQNAVVDHWCKENGHDFEYGGERLLPIRDAASVLASLRPDLQQAYLDGKLSFEQAATIAKSKVPLEEQQLPSSEPAVQPTPDAAQGTGSEQQNQSETAASGPEPTASDGQQNPGDSGNGDRNPVPSPRNSETPETEETKDDDEVQSEAPSQTGPEAALSTPAGVSPQGNNPQTVQPSGAVATLADRGVIPVTTVKDIYVGLKERLSAEEFEELQDLILGD
ncbi:ParB/RepB/Spo0J family partition protein [Streptomyces sp. NPDC001404]|uniref:ParB/RepB/Spo0J family partition protein n=1 Tax=Streptomyces sp. NPDC001404 TaxID=3364571 RepID=UPI00368FE6A6